MVILVCMGDVMGVKGHRGCIRTSLVCCGYVGVTRVCGVSKIRLNNKFAVKDWIKSVSKIKDKI